MVRIGIATAFILLTTWLVSRGAEESSRTTLVLTVVQYGGLILFAGLMVAAVFNGEAAPTAESFSWQWLNPLAIDGFDALLGGFLVALFIFWGFDASLAMSEESTGDSAQAGRTGVIAMVIILVTYVLFTIAALAFAGVDEADPLSLTHEDNIDDVFIVMATEAIGAQRGGGRGAHRGDLGVLRDHVDGHADRARPAGDGHLQGAAGPVRQRRRGHAVAEVRHLVHGPADPGDLPGAEPDQRRHRRRTPSTASGISICAYYIVAVDSSVSVLPPDRVRVRAHRPRPGDPAGDRSDGADYVMSPRGAQHDGPGLRLGQLARGRRHRVHRRRARDAPGRFR